MENPAERPRILLVEDEFLIADELARMLDVQGYDVVGPVPTVARALKLLTDGRIAGAIIDINLRGERAYAVADSLREHRIPFVFSTGYTREMLPARYHDVPYFEKPIDPAKLAPHLFAQICQADDPEVA